MTDIEPHLFWITSRAAGITAMVLASLSVGLGLSMAARLGGRLGDRRALHETLSLGVMVALAVHALALLGDAYMSPSLADVLVPLHWDYRTAWLTLGIVSGWALVLFGLTYYARRRMAPNRWKVIHRLTLAAWIGGLVHAVGMGTDATEVWFLVLLALTAIPPLALLGVRVVERPSAPPRTTARST